MQSNSPPPTAGPPRPHSPWPAMLAGAAMALAGAALILWLQLMIYVPAVEQGRLVAIGIPALLLIDAFGSSEALGIGTSVSSGDTAAETAPSAATTLA